MVELEIAEYGEEHTLFKIVIELERGCSKDNAGKRKRDLRWS